MCIGVIVGMTFAEITGKPKFQTVLHFTTIGPDPETLFVHMLEVGIHIYIYIYVYYSICIYIYIYNYIYILYIYTG